MRNALGRKQSMSTATHTVMGGGSAEWFGLIQADRLKNKNGFSLHSQQQAQPCPISVIERGTVPHLPPPPRSPPPPREMMRPEWEGGALLKVKSCNVF